MNIPIRLFSGSRLAVVLFLNLILLTQTACSPFTGSMQARPEDLSKIFVEPFTTNVSIVLPGRYANAVQMLTDTVRNQLGAENRLQTDISARSLRLVGMIVSYQDATLDVQGELYDGDKFLVYSRVMRHLAPDDDWERGIELVVEQLLDELIGKMRALQQPEYSQYYTPGADSYFYDTSGYANSYFGNDYYRNWGWWRHHRNHDHHAHPETKQHWVSDAIFKELPRSTKIERIHDKSAPPAGSPDTPIGSRAPRSHGSVGSSDSNSSFPQSLANPASGSNPPSSVVPPGSLDASHRAKLAAPRHLDSSSKAISDRQTSGSSASSAFGNIGGNAVPAASLDGNSRSSSSPVSMPLPSGHPTSPSPASTTPREPSSRPTSSPALVQVPSSSGGSSSPDNKIGSTPAEAPPRESSSSIGHSPTPAHLPSSGSSSSSSNTMGSNRDSAQSHHSAPSSSFSPAPLHVPSSSASSSSSGGSARGAAPAASHHHKHDK